MPRRLEWFLTAAVLALAGVGCESDRPYEAVYFWGAEVNVVCLCGSDECLWVKGSADISAELRNFVARNTSKPYTGVHIRFTGYPLAPARDGFPADYDGQFQVERLLSLSTEIPANCLDR